MQNLPADVQEFLDRYPDTRDDKNLTDNLEFYSNTKRCRPDNLRIEEIHERYAHLQLLSIHSLIGRKYRGLDGSGTTIN